MNFRTRGIKLIERFASGQKGAAAVEFAIGVPFMLILYLGAVEASTAIIIDSKAQTIASALGDLVSRAENHLSSDDLTDYFKAASGIMLPYDATGVTQHLVGVKVSPSGESNVIWAHNYQEGKATPQKRYEIGDQVVLPAELLAITADQTVILTEASYSYRPTFSLVFDQAITILRQSYHIPRTSKGISFSK